MPSVQLLLPCDLRNDPMAVASPITRLPSVIASAVDDIRAVQINTTHAQKYRRAVGLKVFPGHIHTADDALDRAADWLAV